MRRTHPPSSRPFAFGALALSVVTFSVAALLTREASAQVVEADARTSVFIEPSPTSHMLVVTPSATVSATPVEALSLSAGYSADVVSGASEAVKAGPTFAAPFGQKAPDIVSAASVHDFRQVATGGFTLHKGHTDLGGAYGYGTEHDYRSNAITVTSGTDFFERNTKLEFAYAHGFDKVCDLTSNEFQDPTARQRLDQSKGCFTSDPTKTTLPISTDNFQGAWTQSFTPTFATQLVLTGAVQQGFLSNPYRSVVIGPSGEAAQEHHPNNRARGAVALRFKYFIRPINAAVGGGVRLYRDTWNIVGQTYELEFDQSLNTWLSFNVRGRFYHQTGASFWSDDYTGGEPQNGPRGQYFSGDREVSPLRNLLGGARVTGAWHGHPGARIGHLFLDFEASLGATFLKTFLEDFTWAGRKPDDTFAMVFGGNVTGTF